MNKIMAIIIITTTVKEVEGFKKTASTAESENICSRSAKNLAIIIETIIKTIIRDGTTMGGNKIEINRITKITETIHHLSSNKITIIHLTIFKQITSNKK